MDRTIWLLAFRGEVVGLLVTWVATGHVLLAVALVIAPTLTRCVELQFLFELACKVITHEVVLLRLLADTLLFFLGWPDDIRSVIWTWFFVVLLRYPHDTRRFLFLLLRFLLAWPHYAFWLFLVSKIVELLSFILVWHPLNGTGSWSLSWLPIILV